MSELTDFREEKDAVLSTPSAKPIDAGPKTRLHWLELFP